MRRASTILIFVMGAMAVVSCDSTLNIDPPYEKYFLKYIGTENEQWGVDLATDANSDLYVLGNSNTTSNGVQIYLVKTNQRGDVQWEKTLGDAGDEDARDVEVLANGDLMVLANRTDIGTSERDFVIYRINSIDGSVIGTPRIDGTAGKIDIVNSITQIADGFIVSGSVDKGGYVAGTMHRYDNNLGAWPSWTVEVEQKQSLTGFDVIFMKSIQFDANLFYTFGYTNTILDGQDGISDYNFFIHVSDQLNGNKNTIFIQGPDPSSNERLASVKAVPPQSGAGFILTGYTSNANTGQQDLYTLKIVQLLEFVKSSIPSTYLQSDPRTITSGLSAISGAKASVFASSGEGFFVMGDQDNTGNGNIFLTKITNNLQDAWANPHPSFSFGGAGNDTSGAVIETQDGRIILCGTMVLGDVPGQRKIVLMKLSSNGLLGE